jgi:glycosyltransferase involved in cell wall biosynthesis
VPDVECVGACKLTQPSAIRPRPRVALVIPTLNEEQAISGVIAEVPPGSADEIIVVDSGSTDSTVARARAAGAKVLIEAKRGYGRACHAGAIAAADCDIVVFLDGDGSDCPELIPLLLEPLLTGDYGFIIGSRTRGQRERGSMSAHQILAGYLAGAALRLLYGVRFTDMCPFRAIRRDALLGLGMREATYGWNLEMQMRAARAGLRILEIPVRHRRRSGGVSKVSGSICGTIKASCRIALAFVRIALEGSGRRATLASRQMP